MVDSVVLSVPFFSAPQFLQLGQCIIHQWVLRSLPELSRELICMRPATSLSARSNTAEASFCIRLLISDRRIVAACLVFLPDHDLWWVFVNTYNVATTAVLNVR